MKALYDSIGTGYADRRRPDPRIARTIDEALGGARSVLNVGAGAGSYEPDSRDVTALELSAEMIRQRTAESAPVCQGRVEALPFADDQFDAAMAILTVHHWSDFAKGVNEMRRVSKGRLVFLTFDPQSDYFWLADYVPEIVEIDQPIMPRMGAFRRLLGEVSIAELPIPHDCSDGFLGAYWRRPAAYLDAGVRAAISTFAKLPGLADALSRLEQDLQSGAWHDRYGYLMDQA